MVDEYSKEWNSVLEAANQYQKRISVFFKCDKRIMIADLKKALLNRDYTFHALKIVADVPDKVKTELIAELIHVIIFSNVSYSYLAKQVILGLENDLVKPHVMALYNNYVFRDLSDAYAIKDMAQLLYDLKYEDELFKFIHSHFDLLVQTGFIEVEDDVKKQ